MAATTFHPDLRRIAALLPRGIVGPRRLPILRALERLGQSSRPVAGIEVVALGAIALRLHRPSPSPPSPLPAILWIHGGGYVLGSAAQDDDLCRHLSSALGAVVAAVDYRLAPEHPFPVPLHDCHDALVWLARRDDVDRRRIAIAGASAGGGLTAALALLARERGEVRPAFQLLTYPMLDDRTTARPRPTSAACGCGTRRRTVSAGARTSTPSRAGRRSAASPLRPGPATCQPCRRHGSASEAWTSSPPRTRATPSAFALPVFRASCWSCPERFTDSTS